MKFLGRPMKYKHYKRDDVSYKNTLILCKEAHTFDIYIKKRVFFPKFDPGMYALFKLTNHQCIMARAVSSYSR